MNYSACVIVIVSAIISAASSYKLLVVSPVYAKSHAILGEGLVRPLVNAGHEVTYVCAFPPEKAHPKIRVIEIKYDDSFKKSGGLFSLEELMEKKESLFNIIDIFKIIENITRTVITDENLKKLMSDNGQQFDVAIVEWLFSDIYSAFASVFDCPLIWVSSMEPHWKILKLVDEVTNPAYTTDLFSSNTPPFTFQQRLGEMGFRIFGSLIDRFMTEDFEQALYDRHVAPIIQSKGRVPPQFEALKYNASLILGNSHVSLGFPSRLPDSYKSIGGYHIDIKVKPLPEDLKKLFDDAEHGVIYFSMGSNLKSVTLPDQVKQSLLKMFGRLKETVLWKFEVDLPNRPPNVHIVQWSPQQSILAHEKCLMFITHGGLLSTTEAIHFGVPIIGIPVFADQFVNVARAVKKGFARKVDLSYTVADDLYEQIQEILSNSTYKQKVKELSLIYHDRPVPPEVELVHWVEHVIRTRGAPHLRSPALNVPWYQKIYLDLVALVIAFVLIIKHAIKYLISIIRSKKHSYKKLN